MTENIKTLLINKFIETHFYDFNFSLDNLSEKSLCELSNALDSYKRHLESDISSIEADRDYMVEQYNELVDFDDDEFIEHLGNIGFILTEEASKVVKDLQNQLDEILITNNNERILSVARDVYNECDIKPTIYDISDEELKRTYKDMIEDIEFNMEETDYRIQELEEELKRIGDCYELVNDLMEVEEEAPSVEIKEIDNSKKIIRSGESFTLPEGVGYIEVEFVID